MNTTLRAHILLVEDDRSIGSMASTALTHFGHVVDWAESANEAFNSLCGRENYDVVLLDLGLGDVEGTSVIIEAEENGCNIPPVIVFSAQPLSELVRAMQVTHAAGYLQKPCSLEALQEMVQIALSSPNRTSRFKY